MTEFHVYTLYIGRFKKSQYYQIFATSSLSVVPKVKYQSKKLKLRLDLETLVYI